VGRLIFYPEGQKASAAFRMLTRRLRSHTEDNAPLAEADLGQAAVDPAAPAFICIDVGALVRAPRRKRRRRNEGWPPAFARASTLAREIVVRQTRLLAYSQYLGTGGSHDRAKESKTQEGQSDLADWEA
jgi:hypothetical protein